MDGLQDDGDNSQPNKGQSHADQDPSCRQPPQAAERPFAHLRLAPSDFLDALAGGARSACAECGRSRKFYCHACCVPVPAGQPLPVVRLPFAVRIIKHPAEYHGKSTSPHAVILSPDCRAVRYPLLPDELSDPLNGSSMALVYPGAGAISVVELVARMAATAPEEEGAKPDPGERQQRWTALEERMRRWTILFVDSTWQQANAIVNDDRLRDLPRVALSNHSSHYWRYGDGLTPAHLSTIEAVYYLCTDVHLALSQLGYCGDYDGRYDNLLLYFNHLYRLLFACYDGGRACGDRKRKHFRLK